MSALDDSVCVQVPATPLDEKKTLIEGNTEKFVVDEVSGWLRVFSDGTVDRTWTGPPEVQFLATPYFPSSANAAADGVTVHDLTVDTFSGLALRVYLPAGSEAEVGEHFPVLLHFHGGGFCISRPSWHMYYQFYARLAAATGAAVVSVYTRPAPEHRLPAAVDDCFAGLLWLRSLAQSPPPPAAAASSSGDHPAVAALRRRGDFSRVFLIGESSGGNLVHEVAALAGRQEDDFWAPLRLAGAVPIHPGFVRSTRSRSEMDCSLETPFLTLDMLDKFLYLALPEGATKDHPITCPMGPQAPEMAGLRMPPVMVVVAERDLIRDTEMEYCEAMKAAGKEVEVVEESGVGHSFYLNKLAVDFDPHVGSQTAALIESIKDFVNRH
ncbi:unnamed protein product [Spirodela intermedia]|uniref:Alpha/beta hydrolase fold-3 domain-containing protein n=1 Tax=Spirodela intermedia TaxID=51605 RepID=A0A7I8KQJ5_SPIIN|nr:unnamed protein product [Spirodela intermedia]